MFNHFLETFKEMNYYKKDILWENSEKPRFRFKNSCRQISLLIFGKFKNITNDKFYRTVAYRGNIVP